MKTNLLTYIGGLIGDIDRAHAASRNFERLSAMSDERLAARGLTRADIARVAFTDAFRK